MSEILVRMKVDVWRDGTPELSWVYVTRRSKKSVYFNVLLRGRDGKPINAERTFPVARLYRIENAFVGKTLTGAASVRWLQDDREPIQGGEQYKMALADVLEMINAEFRRAAVRINELEDTLER